MMKTEQASNRKPLLTIAILFLRLGATAFGGPIAHIAIMEDELVVRRSWLTKQEFIDLLAASNLIPGPSSTELAMHIGHKQAGLAGLFIAGICFILPAALMVAVLAAVYVKYGTLPETRGLLYGLKPVVIAIVFHALWSLGRSALKNALHLGVAVVVAGLYCLGINQIVLLFGTGLTFTLWHFRYSKKHEQETGILLALVSASAALILFTLAMSAYTPAAPPYRPAALFFYFLKTGSVIYGSGYVLTAFLRSDLVTNYHWISSSQLLDAIAAGQITPGPVFTTATFIGYILGGPPAAVLATVAIFLPAFLLVALSSAIIRKMRSSALASTFLDAVNVAAFGLIAAVLIQLLQSAVIDLTTAGIALVAALLLLRFRLNPVWLMLGGAIFGLLKGA